MAAESSSIGPPANVGGMPDINPGIPVVGQPDSTEEPKVVTALSQLIAAVNNVDTDQIADGTIVAADIADGAVTYLKQAVGDNGPAHGAFAASLVSDAVLGTASPQNITCTGEEGDVSSAYNNTTGIYTCPVNGWYRFSWLGSCNALNADGNWTVSLHKGGAIFKRGSSCFQRGVSEVPRSGGTVTIPCNAGDQFALAGYFANGGSSVTARGGTSETYWSGELVGRT